MLALPVMLLIVKTPLQGAQTSIYCAVSEELFLVSGHYFGNCKMEDSQLSLAAQSDEDGERLWSMSAKLVGLEEN